MAPKKNKAKPEAEQNYGSVDTPAAAAPAPVAASPPVVQGIATAPAQKTMEIMLDTLKLQPEMRAMLLLVVFIPTKRLLLLENPIFF